LIFESLFQPFLNRKKTDTILSSTPHKDNVSFDFEDISVGFLDTGGLDYSTFYELDRQSSLEKQASLIKTYRKIANTPEVDEAISHIIDDAVFNPLSSNILELVFKTNVNKNIKDNFINEFNSIINKTNLNKRIYSMFTNFYIDGQLSLHCAYDEDNPKFGIKKLTALSPFGLYYNKSKDRWFYEKTTSLEINSNQSFDTEEVIRIDSGIYDDNIILGYLHKAVKHTNMLNTMEDMLVPIRFMRSVSRRVFNVDVSKLNAKKAEEVMKKNEMKFKYKKFYNINEGTISNQQHIASLTEDYWFLNRGGEKGTTVDTLDETGNLGEIDDILYVQKKVYKSLKVPRSRLDNDNNGGDFSFDDTSVTRDELKFFTFISRIRNQFLDLFYELLRRELIYKGLIDDSEWLELRNTFDIKFVTENSFFSKMERDRFSESINLYNEAEDLLEDGYISREFIFKKVLKFNDEEIAEMAKQIENEKTDPLYKRFRDLDNDDDD